MKAAKIVSLIFLGLWLAGCSHTSTPTPVEPTKQEVPEKKSAGKPSAETQAEPKSPETREQTKTSQSGFEDASPGGQEKATKDAAAGKPPSPETAEHESTQGTRKTTETDRVASADTAEAKQAETTETTDTGGTASPATADAKLEKAREDLRVSQATEKKIAAELGQLKNSGTASAETIRDYEVYHGRVEDMVAENRKIVEEMEAAAARHSAGQRTAPGAAAAGKQEKMMDPDIPEEQTRDEVAALDRELSASLSEFDEKLLKEMDAIREGSADKMRDLAEEAAAAAKRLRERLKEPESEGSGGKDTEKSESAGDADQAETDKQTGDKSETGGSELEETDSGDPSRGGGKGPQKDQPRRYDGAEDDDIVARQLREAAENETDPVLKEKLWKEYEEYKKNQS